MITKILVPLDGSEHAYKALDWALDLAEKYHARIKLLTVIPLLETFVTGTYSKPGKFPLLGPTPEEMQKRANAMLQDALKRAEKINPDIEVTTEVLEGRPSDKIIESATEGKYDLIVMGSRGLGGAKEFFLGSVSDRVACEAKATVVIVK
jgi:nucleotide-binding universal stress UspA family protein